MLKELMFDLVAPLLENRETVRVKRLQSFMGKWLWVAGVLEHTRWVVRHYENTYPATPFSPSSRSPPAI
jgi:hypothetical protein